MLDALNIRGVRKAIQKDYADGISTILQKPVNWNFLSMVVKITMVENQCLQETFFLMLSKGIPKNKGYQLNLNNWFPSFQLTLPLKMSRVYLTAKLRKKFSNNFPIPSKNELRKQIQDHSINAMNSILVFIFSNGWITNISYSLYGFLLFHTDWVFHMLDICKVSGWLLYCWHCKQRPVATKKLNAIAIFFHRCFTYPL